MIKIRDGNKHKVMKKISNDNNHKIMNKIKKKFKDLNINLKPNQINMIINKIKIKNKNLKKIQNILIN